MDAIGVSVGDYKLIRGKENLYIEGLSTCIGVALLGKKKRE